MQVQVQEARYNWKVSECRRNSNRAVTRMGTRWEPDGIYCTTLADMIAENASLRTSLTATQQQVDQLLSGQSQSPALQERINNAIRVGPDTAVTRQREGEKKWRDERIALVHAHQAALQKATDEVILYKEENVTLATTLAQLRQREAEIEARWKAHYASKASTSATTAVDPTSEAAKLREQLDKRIAKMGEIESANKAALAKAADETKRLEKGLLDRIDSLQRERKKAVEKATKLEGEIDDLQDALDEAKSKIEVYAALPSTSSVGDIAAAAEATKAAEAASAAAAAEASMKEAARVKAEIAKLTEVWKTSINNANIEKNNAVKACQRLQGDLSAERAKQQPIVEKVGQLEKQLEGVQGRLQVVEKERDNYETQVKALKGSMEEHKKEISRLRTDNRLDGLSLKGMLSDKNREVEEEQRKVEKLDKEVQVLKESKRALLEQVEQLEIAHVARETSPDAEWVEQRKGLEAEVRRLKKEIEMREAREVRDARGVSGETSVRVDMVSFTVRYFASCRVWKLTYQDYCEWRQTDFFYQRSHCIACWSSRYPGTAESRGYDCSRNQFCAKDDWWSDPND